jgi:hypothetical protein
MIEIRQNGSHKPPIDEASLLAMLFILIILIIVLINGGLY